MAKARMEMNVRFLAMLLLTIILFAQRAGTDVQAEGEALRDNEQSQTSDAATVTKQVARTDVYGDPLPPGALARLGTIRLRHDHIYGYLATALSPDGKTLATGGSRSLRLWSMADGKLLWQVRENYHYGMIKFSPNGKWLFMGGENLLDAVTGRLVHRFTEAAYPLAFSPDSKFLVLVTRDSSLRLWDTATGKEAGSFEASEKRVHGGVFTADGRRFIGLCHDERIRHWDMADRKLLKTVDLPSSRFHSPEFSPDGSTLAVTPFDGPVSLWSTEDGSERVRLQGDESRALYRLAFSPDGRTLASDFGKSDGTQGQISLWESATGRLIRRFPVPRSTMIHMEFAPDGRTLVTAGTEPRVRLWDSVTGKPLFEHPSHDSDVQSVSFSSEGRTLVSGSRDGTVRVWETATGRHLRELTPHTKGGYQAAVLPDGKRVISSGYDGRIVVQDLQTGKVLQSMVPDPEEGKSKNVSNTPVFAVSADGRSAVSYKRTEAGTTLFHVWDIATGRPLVSRSSTLNALHLVFSPDARVMASHVDISIPSIGPRAGGPDANKKKKGPDKQGVEFTSATHVQLQDAATGRPLLALPMPDRSAYRAAFAPDGRTIMTVTSRDLGERNQQAYTFRLWELATGKERWSLTNPETAYNWYVEQIAFAPDGRSFVAALADNTIRLFDLATGKELLRRAGHEAPVRSLAFAPNGKSLASGHADGTILLWDFSSPKPQRVPAAKPTDDQLLTWWTDLAAADAHQAHAAIWKLANCPEQALPLLSERLRPVDRLRPEQLRSLLTELDSSDFASRREAAERLADLGEQAEPALRKALESNPSAEQKRRIESLLSAPCIVKSPAKLRDLRAVETLEYIGSPAADTILKKLAVGDPFARLTKEAKASLDRLARRTPVEP